MTRFSIVIPTRNRAHLLDGAIRSALTQEHDDFEIVVSTNNCDDDSVAVVRRHMCERLRHVQTRRTLSMPEHWEFAVGHAQGELVGVLCDDDALIPDALRELDELFDRLPDTDAIVYNIARYFHPEAIAGYPPNVLCLQEPSFEVTRPDPDQQLRSIAAGNAVHHVPKMLNCFARRRALDGIRQRSGRWFLPACPDFSFAAGFMLCGYSFVTTDRILGLWGLSESSIGGSQLSGSNSRSKEFMSEFDTDPVAYSPVRVDLIPALVTSSVQSMARACGATVPFDLVDLYLQLLRSVVYQETTYGQSPHRGTVDAALARESSELQAQVARRMREERIPVLSAYHRCRRLGSRLRHATRRLYECSPSLRRLRWWLRPVREHRQPNGDWPLAGVRHGFSTILDASTCYRALERTRFPLRERPAGPTETTRCPADADPELLPEVCQPNKEAP